MYLDLYTVFVTSTRGEQALHLWVWSSAGTNCEKTVVLAHLQAAARYTAPSTKARKARSHAHVYDREGLDAPETRHGCLTWSWTTDLSELVPTLASSHATVPSDDSHDQLSRNSVLL